MRAGLRCTDAQEAPQWTRVGLRVLRPQLPSYAAPTHENTSGRTGHAPRAEHAARAAHAGRPPGQIVRQRSCGLPQISHVLAPLAPIPYCVHRVPNGGDQGRRAPSLLPARSYPFCSGPPPSVPVLPFLESPGAPPRHCRPAGPSHRWPPADTAGAQAAPRCWLAAPPFPVRPRPATTLARLKVTPATFPSEDRPPPATNSTAGEVQTCRGTTLQERRYFQGDLCKFPGTRL
jgi:hypothetical protein